MKSKLDWVRRSTRVIRMISELHRMGYQRARIMPHIHPLAYRIVIAPADLFSRINPAYCGTAYDEPAIAYSSASGSSYFDWEDAKNDNARQLAEKFVDRFPQLMEQCRGSDWCYAGWLCDLLAALERQPDCLPFVMEEWLEPGPEELLEIPLQSAQDGKAAGTFPLPPAFEP